MTAAPAGPLLPDHEKKLLAESAIDMAVVLARGYHSATKKVELERLGFTASQRLVPTLVIPVHSTAGQIAYFQHRPNAPRTDRKTGRVIKYETASGARIVLDVPPLCRPKLGDSGARLLITEGARKADAGCSYGVCTIGLQGVWAWKRGATLPDWQDVQLAGREVFVAFDSDVTTKPAVAHALRELKRMLEHRGAAVRIIYLPAGPGGAKVGLDDFKAAGHSLRDLLALAEDDVRPAPAGGAGSDPFAEVAGRYVALPAGLARVRRTDEGERHELLTNFTAYITGDVTRDDGVEVTRTFELRAALAGHAEVGPFRVPVAQFEGLHWASEQLGPEATVLAGLGARDHARVAIQLLSAARPPDGQAPIPRLAVFAHSGWRRLDGPGGAAWAYLHGGGAIVADGPAGDGQRGDVAVDLSGPLDPFVLPPPPAGAALAGAVRQTLELARLAPARIMAVVQGAVYAAPLGPCLPLAVSPYLVGSTGVFKTELGALAQQHFGAGFHSRALPLSWASTANAIGELLFVAKDALVVVDDFAPAGTTADVQRLNGQAETVLRGAGNRAGRNRLRPDGTPRPARPPRGLALVTGEDLPRGQSLQARLLVAEIGRGDIDADALSVAQERAERGVYAQAMAGYLRWLAGRLDALQATLPGRQQALRRAVAEGLAAASGGGVHARTPDAAALVLTAWEQFLTFAHQAGAVDDAERARSWRDAWQGLLAAAGAQSRTQRQQGVASRFLELLRSALVTGEAHLAGTDGQRPATPLDVDHRLERWGWREEEFGAGQAARIVWVAKGRHIGWVEPDAAGAPQVYLDKDAAYACANRLAQAGEGPLGVQANTLWKRLADAGAIVSKAAPDRLTVRRQINGARSYVLHVALEPQDDPLVPETAPTEPTAPADGPPAPPPEWAPASGVANGGPETAPAPGKTAPAGAVFDDTGAVSAPDGVPEAGPSQVGTGPAASVGAVGSVFGTREAERGARAPAEAPLPGVGQRRVVL